MTLAEAAAVAGDQAVRTEMKDDFDIEQLKVRVFIGQRSTVITFADIDWDKVSGDETVRRKIERQIRAALADL